MLGCISAGFGKTQWTVPLVLVGGNVAVKPIVQATHEQRTKGRRLKNGRTFWGRVMRVRRKFLTSVWCYFTRAQMQTVTTEQLGGDYKGIKCQFDDEAKVEVRKWPFSIAEQDEAQTGSLRASTSSFHVSHYENDVRYRTNLSCFVFVVVLRPFLVTVLHIRGSLSTPWPGDYRWKVAFCLILACLLMYYQVLIHTPPYVRSRDTSLSTLWSITWHFFSVNTNFT